MEMLVETFEQTETLLNGETEGDSEAIRLIGELSLVGQRALLSPDTTTRCPYREMTLEERNVYGVIFPEHTKLEEYRRSMIPVRVLQVAAHAKTLGIYDRLMVWSERTKPTDPILVGQSGSTWSPDKTHILARWGEALAPFSELRSRAIQERAVQMRVEATRVIRDQQRIIDDPISAAEEFISGR